MDGVGNLVELLLFYTLERVLFNRMVGPMSKNPHLVKKAMAICIQPDGKEPIRSNDSPVFVGILDEPINRRFFHYNSEVMFRRFTHIKETVCNRIFGKNGAVEVDDQNVGFRPKVRQSGEGSSRTNNAAARKAGSRTTTAASSVLNPKASGFVPGQMNEDARTMFLTFSKGYPLTRDEEVINFFTSYVT